MKSLKHTILGVSTTKKVKREELLSHNSFYWIVEVKDYEESADVTRKCARGELLIRQFYKVLFKLIDRGNKLAKKWSKGTAWIKRWIKKRLAKMGETDPDIINYIDNTPEDDVKNLLEITDREEMDELLNGDLITVEVLK